MIKRKLKLSPNTLNMYSFKSYSTELSSEEENEITEFLDVPS